MDDTITAYIREHQDELEGLAAELIACDSQNPPGVTRSAATLLRERLESAGLTVEEHTYEDGKPNLLVTLPGQRDRSLILNGHLDTVPYDVDRWDHDPLGEWDGDRLYGRGAADMKGAVAAMVFLAEAYASTGTAPKATIHLVLASDEETGSDAGLKALLDDDRIDGDACIIGEKTSVDGQPAITAADRGSIWLNIVATGEAAHGSRPLFGENAIWRLVAALENLEKELEDHGLDLPEELDTIIEDTVDLYGDPAVRDLLTHPSVNLGRLHGGEAINSVPEHAHAEVDVRITAGCDSGDVLEQVQRVLEEHPGVSIDDHAMSNGTLTTPGSPVVRAMQDASEELTGERTRVVTATGGGDTKNLRNAGIPTIEFGLASDTVHDVDEYITRTDLLADALAYHGAIERFGAIGDDGT